MEKEKKSKKIVVIIILILLLSVGIAFIILNKLGDKDSHEQEMFKVGFSSSNSSLTAGVPVYGGEAQQGEFSTDKTAITGLTAKFTKPGQEATWKLYSYNEGTQKAFLNRVELGTMSLIAGNGVEATKVAEAANFVNVKISIGGTEFTSTNEFIDLHELQKATGEEIIVTITYSSESPLIEGEFEVSIDDIVLEYSSID